MPVTSPDDGDLLVRPARGGDTEALGRLGAALVELHHGFDAQRFLKRTPQTEQGYGAFLRSELTRSEVVMLVAERAGRVCGYVYAALEGVDYMALRGPAGVVYDLMVEPAQRRQGVGRRLLETAMRELVVRGAPRVVLSTAERNHEARRLFESLQFRQTMIEMTWEPPDPTPG
ncbi:GNAT family N-acetyltransferase [Phenylobacterium deserti]|uniref:GNAT family N-acetyltransferase n=1 Tax=Phenylobacterium deserti TaxID=1914756 RepID=A0A328ACC0_9CAUL|nr:GNAT family N-acetyltransferase [Phenylobacterium deserti]RAK52392.1 GNAT family N-acetyltransferase [Phenylobacterium deserti]